MKNLPEIHQADYQYALPDERIARYPVEPRDSSKLLVYQNGNIRHEVFSELAEQLPEDTFLVFNDTKVIPARVFFRKATGAVIEVFLLHPEAPSRIIHDVMQQTQRCGWSCLIGNKKRWKSGERLTAECKVQGMDCRVEAELIDGERNWVAFSWTGGSCFADVIRALGEIPLPPYLGRSAGIEDTASYQTVYSKVEGAVASNT